MHQGENVREILKELFWYENKWTTKNKQLGDAMSANAAMALVTPDDDRIDDFVLRSFKDVRPYRSPAHALDPNVDLTHSFSRDHCLSLCWYSLWSGITFPMLFIARYASANKLKIGAEGTYSQHGLTPNVMWAMNSVANKATKQTRVNLPFYYKMWPSWIIALIQLLSAKSVKVGYRLNLCGEMALIARLTGQWNWVWQKVIDICVERHPENIYYLYIQGKVDPNGIEMLLDGYIESFVMNDQWCWCWMEKDVNGNLQACGQDLLLLKALLKQYPLTRK